MNDDAVLRLAIALHSNPGVYALLVGSGLSRAAGIRTGWEILQDLATKLALIQHEAPTPDPQTWYEKKYGEAPDYSRILARFTGTPAERMNLLRCYFEPTEEEKEQKLKIPTEAHRAIASLVTLGYVRVILTTNFDRLLETALEAEGVTPDVINSEDSLLGAVPYVHSRCTVVKMNGDYRDTRIKNTPEELANYSPAMNALLDRVFDDFGLLVCGWSGQWDIALRNAILRAPSRRYSSFWLSRGAPTDDAEQIVKNRHGVVIPIESADRFFPGLLENVHSLRDMGQNDPVSIRVAVATVKRYLTQPENRIRLHDLVKLETERVYRAITDERFQREGLNAQDRESFQRRMHQYENYVERLASMLSAIAFHDEGGNSSLLTETIDWLVRPKSLAGDSPIVELQFYPALLVGYASGVAALANQRFGTLAAILRQPRLREGKYEEARPALTRFNCTRVFAYSEKHVPRSNAGNKFTPASNYIFDILHPILHDYLPNEEKYEQSFDLFEYLVGLTCVELAEKDYPPIGCFAWRYVSAFQGERPLEKSPLGEFVSSEIQEGSESGLLKAGFFNGDPRRLQTVAEAYLQRIRTVVQRWD